jgi:TetR/AcrR family transcriptional regulator, regulator of autoinduction and epiphytic fitness
MRPMARRSVASSSLAVEPRVDGRRARTVRTRAAIITALLELVAGGDRNPTAAAIAARANISVRSIGQHFATRAELFAAAADHYQQRADSAEPAATLSIEKRVASFVPARARELENSRPIRASAALFASDYPAVATAVRVNADRRRAQVVRVFAAEVSERDPDLVELLDLALGGRVWDALRERGIPAPRTQALITRLVEQLLAV